MVDEENGQLSAPSLAKDMRSSQPVIAPKANNALILSMRSDVCRVFCAETPKTRCTKHDASFSRSSDTRHETCVANITNDERPNGISSCESDMTAAQSAMGAKAPVLPQHMQQDDGFFRVVVGGRVADAPRAPTVGGNAQTLSPGGSARRRRPAAATNDRRHHPNPGYYCLLGSLSFDPCIFAECKRVGNRNNNNKTTTDGMAWPHFEDLMWISRGQLNLQGFELGKGKTSLFLHPSRSLSISLFRFNLHIYNVNFILLANVCQRQWCSGRFIRGEPRGWTVSLVLSLS